MPATSTWSSSTKAHRVRAQTRREAAADRLLRFVHGPSPAERVATLDLGLRPEGGQGRLTRDLAGYASYFARWAETWERQALTAGPASWPATRRSAPGSSAWSAEFVWERPFTETEEADIRRMKARIERERIPTREDPQFHLKLGRGSLSDVEWTVQLLQLRHRIPCAGTMAALDELEGRGLVAGADARALRHAYRFCEHTRNRWHLVGALAGGTPPGDALPAESTQLSRLARSLGTTPATLPRGVPAGNAACPTGRRTTLLRDRGRLGPSGFGGGAGSIEDAGSRGWT